MHRIAEEVLAAEREHSLGVRLLAEEDRDRIRERILSRYGGRSDRVWESVYDHDCVSVQDRDGWKWIREFVGSRRCVLLFDLPEETEMFHVPSGASLDEILENTFGFEFYVTDMEGSYLICFNHHDVLVGCGSAQGWLEARMG